MGILYKWNLQRNDTNELAKQKWTQRLRIQTYGFSGWGWGVLEDGIAGEFGVVMYTRLYLKWIANKDILYSTWNSDQCYATTWMKGESEGERIYVYV